MTTPEQHALWAELDAKRTQGDWYLHDTGGAACVTNSSRYEWADSRICCNENYYPTAVLENDMAFIAQAPSLYAAVKEMQGELDELKKEIARLNALLDEITPATHERME